MTRYQWAACFLTWGLLALIRADLTVSEGHRELWSVVAIAMLFLSITTYAREFIDAARKEREKRQRT